MHATQHINVASIIVTKQRIYSKVKTECSRKGSLYKWFQLFRDFYPFASVLPDTEKNKVPEAKKVKLSSTKMA